MAEMKRLRIQLPKQLVAVIDILRTDMPRSELVNYLLTWYIEENSSKLLVTESEAKRIRKLLSEAKK